MQCFGVSSITNEIRLNYLFQNCLLSQLHVFAYKMSAKTLAKRLKTRQQNDLRLKRTRRRPNDRKPCGRKTRRITQFWSTFTDIGLRGHFTDQGQHSFYFWRPIGRMDYSRTKSHSSCNHNVYNKQENSPDNHSYRTSSEALKYLPQ